MTSSRKYRGERLVVWPPYLDSRTPRSRGRRIPLEKAVPRPSVEEIAEAAQRLGLEPIVEDKSYPKDWMRHRRRVVVKRMGGRVETLVRLAGEIREMRRQRTR